jgi:predicted amidohydrolase
MDNLLTNPALQTNEAEVPAGWQLWAPRADLQPQIDTVVTAAGESLTALAGTGRLDTFGKLGQVVPAEAGQWLEARVTLRAEGIADLSRCSLCNLVWRKEGRLIKEQLLDRVQREGEWLTISQVYQCPEGADSCEIEIFLRHAPEGRLVIREASLATASPRPAPRTARVAAVKLYPPSPSTPQRNRELFCELLDQAGAAGVDICCLPEACNRVALEATSQELAEPVEGESFQAYAACAKRWGMWVVACYNTMEEGTCYNTAVLINRQGELAGTYRKTHLHWPEYREGVTPGDDYPVFQTDFGTIGMMICYDSWFPEVARLLAYKGAEAIFFPVWGYDEILLRGRAVDNNTYIIAGCLGGAASIISSNGDMIARTTSAGIVTAWIALEQRPTVAYGEREITNGIPGATRWTRNTVSLREYEELGEQIVRL